MSDVVNVTGTVRTGPLDQKSGGDFRVFVRRDHLEAAYEQEEADLVVTIASGEFFPEAPAGFYKFLDVELLAFEVLAIRRYEKDVIRIKVRPYDAGESSAGFHG